MMYTTTTFMKGAITLDRPYIICHMLTSLDGKIIGDYLNVERAAYFTDLFFAVLTSAYMQLLIYHLF